MTEEETAKVAIARLDGWIPHDGGTCPEVARWNKSALLFFRAVVSRSTHMSMLAAWKNDHFCQSEHHETSDHQMTEEKSPPQ